MYKRTLARLEYVWYWAFSILSIADSTSLAEPWACSKDTHASQIASGQSNCFVWMSSNTLRASSYRSNFLIELVRWWNADLKREKHTSGCQWAESTLDNLIWISWMHFATSSIRCRRDLQCHTTSREVYHLIHRAKATNHRCKKFFKTKFDIAGFGSYNWASSEWWGNYWVKITFMDHLNASFQDSNNSSQAILICRQSRQ